MYIEWPSIAKTHGKEQGHHLQGNPIIASSLNINDKRKWY
jgi:hypothetical protein